MTHTKALPLLIALTTAATAAAAQAESRFTTLFENQSDRDFSGNVLITRGNATLFSHSTLEKKQSAQFVIGSLSKQVTAALVLKAIEQTRLSPDESIRLYVPDLPADWEDRVTIANLLNHTSGVTRPGEPLAHTPGSTFKYSNYGYDLLARALEQTTGKSYAELTGDLFNHCSLHHSFAPTAQFPSSSAENLVPGYFEQKQGKQKLIDSQFPLLSVPSGGLVSTTTDLSRWNQCLYHNREISNDFSLLVTPTATRKHRWGDVGYGAGLQISTTTAGQEYSHSGYVLGYISTMAYYPTHNVSLIILENVAWNPGDMARVFGIHDQIRAAVVDQLSSQNPSHQLSY